jgi:hypothetical protein
VVSDLVDADFDEELEELEYELDWLEVELDVL